MRCQRQGTAVLMILAALVTLAFGQGAKLEYKVVKMPLGILETLKHNKDGLAVDSSRLRQVWNNTGSAKAQLELLYSGEIALGANRMASTSSGTEVVYRGNYQRAFPQPIPVLRQLFYGFSLQAMLIATVQDKTTTQGLLYLAVRNSNIAKESWRKVDTHVGILNLPTVDGYHYLTCAKVIDGDVVVAGAFTQIAASDNHVITIFLRPLFAGANPTNGHKTLSLPESLRRNQSFPSLLESYMPKVKYDSLNKQRSRSQLVQQRCYQLSFKEVEIAEKAAEQIVSRHCQANGILHETGRRLLAQYVKDNTGKLIHAIDVLVYQQASFHLTIGSETPFVSGYRYFEGSGDNPPTVIVPTTTSHFTGLRLYGYLRQRSHLGLPTLQCKFWHGSDSKPKISKDKAFPLETYQQNIDEYALTVQLQPRQTALVLSTSRDSGQRRLWLMRLR